MPERSPAFQFYPGDFLSSSTVASMTMEERGLYVTLLCHAWMDGSIPADAKALAKLTQLRPARFRKLWVSVQKSFVVAPASKTRLVNNRLEMEREKQARNRDFRSKNGKKGAAAKWLGHRPANGLANGGAIGLPMAKNSPSGHPSGDPLPPPEVAGLGASKAMALAARRWQQLDLPARAELAQRFGVTVGNLDHNARWLQLTPEQVAALLKGAA